jgi:hypothetical protein
MDTIRLEKWQMYMCFPDLDLAVGSPSRYDLCAVPDGTVQVLRA